MNFRNYSGTCRSCKAPEMVECKPDCEYDDPWKDYYLGPGDYNRKKAKVIREEEVAATKVHLKERGLLKTGG